MEHNIVDLVQALRDYIVNKNSATLANIADTEDQSTASKAYSVGDYLIRNGIFYKVKSAISSGDTFVIDVNIEAVQVDDELVRLQGDIGDIQDDTDNISNDLTNITDLLTTLTNYVQNINRRTRRDITSDLTNLPAAVAEQDLEKYGYAIGDYFNGPSGYQYILSDKNTYYGGYNNYAVVSIPHISIVVKTVTNSQWNTSSNTSTGYARSVLHTYLKETVLEKIKTDFNTLFGNWSSHMIAHRLLLSIGTSEKWEWSAENEYISALSEAQIYGTNVMSIDGISTGEAFKWLEVFRKFSYYEIFGNMWLWLRNIFSASDACFAPGSGSASAIDVTNFANPGGLILFH